MENRDISYRNHLDRNNGIKEEWKIRNDDSEDRRCTRFLTTASGATIFSDPWNRAGIGQFYRTILFATIDFAFPRTSWSLLPRKKQGGARRRKRDAVRLTAMIPVEANYVRGVRKDAGQFRREPS